MRREQRKRMNSFRDIIIVIFVVLVCFGLTIYGIVYLTGKIFGGEEKVDNVTVAAGPVTSNPDEGDVIIYNDNEAVIDTTGDNGSLLNIPGAVRSDKYPNIIEAPAPANISQGVTPPPAEEVPPAVLRQSNPSKTAPKSAEVKPDKTQKPVAAEKPKQAALSSNLTVASVPKGNYVVQIMAVKSQSAAETEALKYKNICSDVFIQKADLEQKGIWYRIRCGVSDTKEGAEVVKKKLESAFNVKPTIVTNK